MIVYERVVDTRFSLKIKNTFNLPVYCILPSNEARFNVYFSTAVNIVDSCVGFKVFKKRANMIGKLSSHLFSYLPTCIFEPNYLTAYYLLEIFTYTTLQIGLQFF